MVLRPPFPLGVSRFERPETDGRQAIGLSEVTQRIHIGHGEDLVLGVVSSNHHGDPYVVKGDAALLVECRRRLNGRLPHLACPAHHRAVRGVC